MFCSKCGTPVGGYAQPTPPVQPIQAAPQPAPAKPFDKRILLGVGLLFLILVVPVFPRDKIVYVNGSTQTMTLSTSYNTAFQTYTTNTQMDIKVYKGTLEYLTDDYYNQYYQYWYGNYNNCYYDPYSGNVYCTGYSYWPYYGQSSYYYKVTIDPSDNVVKVEQTQESNGLWTLTLTHYDGTADTYRHVYQSDLTKTASSTVPGTATVVSTITNSVVNPVTFSVPCNECVPEHITERVSILQMLLGY